MRGDEARQPAREDSELTIGEALRLGTERLARAGMAHPRLDMSLLLAKAVGMDRLGLYLDLSRRLDDEARRRTRELLARRLKYEPVAYILGQREFFSLTFEVTPAVLIPRPETEHVVEIVLEWMDNRPQSGVPPLCADIGTGCGAIAVACAHACPEARWIATDHSAPALEVAARNAARHNVQERIEFRYGSLYEPVTEPLDLICSNPPYIDEAERTQIAPDVRDWEPGVALFCGEQGLEILKRLIVEAPLKLKSGGLLALEVGKDQSAAVKELIEGTHAFGPARTRRDLAGIERVVYAARYNN